MDKNKNIPKKYKEGHCYYNAYKFLMEQDDPDYRLVHGWVVGTAKAVKGVKYCHAWVEHIGKKLVVDPSMRLGDPVVVPDFIYYHIGSVDLEKIIKYTKQQMLEEVLRTGTYGPWDSMFDE